ncbi:MAG: DNA integrity scanning protein DisA nucleotide-binding domain protein [Deltaproteobacteria bacterium]|nr:DNA integrity scanning protein DisA nucleotide-binding domain protein [Deltaproteobacteria bacterium]
MNSTNAHFIKIALQTAAKVKAKAVMIYADPLEDLNFEGRWNKKADLFLLSKKKTLEPNGDKASLLNHCKAVLQLPKIRLTRLGVIKVATTTALSLDYLQPGDKVVCAVGSAETGVLDQIQILDTAKDSEIVMSRGMKNIAENIRPEVFQTVLHLSIELAEKGREGKPVGTIFVVGDHEKVLPLTKQMIINPFKGYEEEERNVVAPSLKETIREFAAMDGAFIVSGEGIVLTAGAYLGAACEEANLPRGLGSRHLAAAGITNLTGAVAFVISESSGDVRIFKNGKILTQIEKIINK